MSQELDDQRNLVLFSGAQTEANQPYYHFSEDFLRGRLSEITNAGNPKVLFVPYAQWHNANSDKMFESATENGQWGRFGVNLTNIDKEPNKRAVIEKADAIIVGGGSIHTLLAGIQELGIVEPLQEKIRAGCLYIGTSAGSVLATPAIYGTNEPPILHLRSHGCLGIVPFGITPHYTDGKENGNSGPSVKQRIRNFMVLNPDAYPIMAMPDGTWLNLKKGEMRLEGNEAATLYIPDKRELVIPTATDISFLLDERSEYFRRQ